MKRINSAKLKRYPKEVVIAHARKQNTKANARKLAQVDSGSYTVTPIRRSEITSRICIRNTTYKMEWENTPEAMEEAKMFRFCNPEFKGRHIKPILQMRPDTTPLRRILEIETGRDVVNEGIFRKTP